MRLALFSLASVLLSSALPPAAASILVTTDSSVVPGASTCTLGQAIYAANLANNPTDATPTGATTVAPLSDSVITNIGTGTCTGAAGGTNTISLQNFAGKTLVFDPANGIYPTQSWNTGVADAADNYWYGPNALPPIASTITIEGYGATLSIPNTVLRLRFFFVGADPQANYGGILVTPGYNTPGPGNLTLHNLTLTGGKQLGGSGSLAGAGMGGAIYNQGTLTLNSVTMARNNATGGNTLESNIGGGGMGGDNSGTQGGGMGGAVPLGTSDRGSDYNVKATPQIVPSGGGTQNGLGGGIAFDSESSGNGSGFGMWLGYAAGGGGGGGFGGGHGGLSYVNSATPNGPPGGAFGAGGSFRTDAGAGGGGVGGGAGYGCGTEESPAGGYGGGGSCYLFTGSNGNTSGFGGSLVDPISGDNAGGAGLGGAIFNHFATVTIVNSTLTANSASGGQGGGYSTPPGAGQGGAVFNLNGEVFISFSTLASNSASTDGGAVYNLGFSSDASGSTGSLIARTILANSVLSGSTVAGGSTSINDLVDEAPATLPTNNGQNVAAAWVDEGAGSKNLVMRSTVITSSNGKTIFPTDLVSADPKLGPLDDNGGFTPTMLPAAGSPVIDAAGNCNDANGNLVTMDQRGASRPVGSACDLGAIEYRPPIIVNTTADETVAGDGKCSLREALNNSNSASDTTGGDCASGHGFDEIEFDATVFPAGQVTAISIPSADGVIGACNASILGDDRVAIDGGGATRLFTVFPNCTTIFDHLTLRNGNANPNSGGAISVQGSAVVRDSTLERNQAVNGGAVSLETGAAGATIERSTFARNTTSGAGGALYINAGNVNVINSTLAGNIAAGEGGAVFCGSGCALSINASTIAANTAPKNGALDFAGTLSIANSALANAGTPNCSSAIGDLGGNIDSGTSCVLTAAGSMSSKDPLLGPLAGNGGSTWTMVPQIGSPARDAIANCKNFPATDQRGQARPVGSGCDIGAMESLAPAVNDRIFADNFDGTPTP